MNEINQFESEWNDDEVLLFEDSVDHQIHGIVQRHNRQNSRESGSGRDIDSGSAYAQRTDCRQLYLGAFVHFVEFFVERCH